MSDDNSKKIYLHHVTPVMYLDPCAYCGRDVALGGDGCSRKSVAIAGVRFERIPYSLSDINVTLADTCAEGECTGDECGIAPGALPDGAIILTREMLESMSEEDRDSLRCHDCGTPIDGFHHAGCDAEFCPKCGEQIITCSCSKEGDFVVIGEDDKLATWMSTGSKCAECDNTKGNEAN